MRVAIAGILLVAGCRLGFSDVPDALESTHVDGPIGLSDAVVTLGDGVTIDTTLLTVTNADVAVSVYPQPGGPELAVIAVGSFAVEAGATVRVVGMRPLVVVAHDIAITGTLDAGAHGANPGAGGSNPASGAGAGGTGVKVMDTSDGAGGGAGFGTAGGDGGASMFNDVTPGGSSYGDTDLATLVGGSGGGGASGGACPASLGGAGGGAIQLSATVAITLDGAILVGGGGGAGGNYCNDADAGAGGGGGSGGAIFLEAPEIHVAGVLGIGGGGGGGGANGASSNGPTMAGNPGTDGGLVGGIGGAMFADTTSAGGNGGASSTRATGSAPTSNNPGGGGGALGRVVQHRL